MTLHIALVKIPVSSVTQAAPFYRDVLGLAEEFVVGEYGWAQFKTGNLTLALYEPGKGGGSAPAGSSDHVHFTVEDGNGLRARLVKAGLTPDDMLHSGADGTVFYELRDPDGNLFKVFVG